MGKIRVFENKKGKITYFFFFLSTFLGTLVVLNLSKIQGQFFYKWVHVINLSQDYETGDLKAYL